MINNAALRRALTAIIVSPIFLLFPLTLGLKRAMSMSTSMLEGIVDIGDDVDENYW